MLRNPQVRFGGGHTEKYMRKIMQLVGCLSYPSGTAVASFGLAVNRQYTNSDGEKVDDVCYIDIVAWNRLAEVAGGYLSKGQPIFVEGRLQLDSWEDQDGKKRSKLKVVAQNIQFLGSGKADNSEEKNTDEVPF